jgi:hypothetical protein
MLLTLDTGVLYVPGLVAIYSHAHRRNLAEAVVRPCLLLNLCYNTKMIIDFVMTIYRNNINRYWLYCFSYA